VTFSKNPNQTFFTKVSIKFILLLFFDTQFKYLKNIYKYSFHFIENKNENFFVFIIKSLFYKLKKNQVELANFKRTIT